MQPPPEPHDTVRIYLPAGTKTRATWMGDYWWAYDHRLEPDQVTRWEPLVDQTMRTPSTPFPAGARHQALS